MDLRPKDCLGVVAQGHLDDLSTGHRCRPIQSTLLSSFPGVAIYSLLLFRRPPRFTYINGFLQRPDKVPKRPSCKDQIKYAHLHVHTYVHKLFLLTQLPARSEVRYGRRLTCLFSHWRLTCHRCKRNLFSLRLTHGIFPFRLRFPVPPGTSAHPPPHIPLTRGSFLNRLLAVTTSLHRPSVYFVRCPNEALFPPE